jgi:hypothetical protein
VVSLGIGLALTKAELDRRSAKLRRARERRFAPKPAEQLSDGLRRMTLGQLDVAIDALQSDSGSRSTREIHETRKAIKRLRALLRLLRVQIGQSEFSHETELLRDCAGRLAGARDAEVMSQTLKDLVERHPKRLGANRRVARLSDRLLAESKAASAQTLSSDARAVLLDQLCAMRQRVDAWRLLHGDFELIDGALCDIYRRGERAYGKARKRNDPSVMHDWRKRVKDLRYAAQALTRSDAKRASDLQHMRALARRADRLAEILGEEHDLAMLGELVRERRDLFDGHKRIRKTLLRLIDERRARLRRKALGLGGELYEQRPKKFVRSVKRAQRRA